MLAWVPGHPLTGHNPAERRLIGTTLARVHRALAGGDTAAAQRLHWVDPDAGYLSLRPWLRPAIAAALAALDAADPAAMSWGLLHADPAPEAFRLDPATGRISSSPGMIASRVFALVRLAREVVRWGWLPGWLPDRIHARSLPVSLQPLRLRSQGPSAAA